MTSWEQEVRDRQEFRSQMVSNFGFTVMDHGVALTLCPKCENLQSINSAFPDSDWNSLPHLLSVLETFLDSRTGQLVCSSCKTSFNPASAKENLEYWLWHSHFLPEVKRDLQLLVHRKNGLTGWVEGMLVEETGEIMPLSIPTAEPEFKDKAGCFFSVRQVWNDFLKEQWPVKRFAALEISDGYYLVVNPAVDSEADLQEFKDNCVKLVGKSTSTTTHYEFADLSWADTWNFEENTYHQWLSDYASDLSGSDVIAGVLASPAQFYITVHNELRPFGCWLRRADEEGSLAFLGDDEYFVSFDYREYLINAMIKGYSYWGALRFIEPVLELWEQTREVGERLKALLLHYKCTISGGHQIQFRAKRGKKIIKEFDLTTLSQSDDELEADAAFISWIAPQLSLNPETLRFET
jgi:hypothetical protein